MATSDTFTSEKETEIPDCRNCKIVSCSVFSQSNFSPGFNPQKKLIQIKSGEYLFKENDISEGVFCVMQGKLLVEKKGSNTKSQIIALAEPGEILGVSSILNHNIYTTSLLAIENVKACFFTREQYLALVRDNPGIGMATMSKLGNKLNMLEKRV